MIRKIERGKHLAASFYWTEFAINNMDIVTALDHTPLQVKNTGTDKYDGKIFGIRLQMQYLSRQRSNKQGCIKILSDIRLPLSLGRTYATTSFTYYAIDCETTFLELEMEMEAVGLMCIYAKMRRKCIKDYIDHICAGIETAAQLLALDDNCVNTILNESQKSRVAEYRNKVVKMPPFSSSISSTLEASINLSMVKEVMVIEANVVMPDKHFMTATNYVSTDDSMFSKIQTAVNQLAYINNPAYIVRGEAFRDCDSIEFHQAALEFGYNLYHDHFGDNLKEIMPVLLFHGKETRLRLNIDKNLEFLPWEALHDGKDFIATKMRFSRALGTVRYNINKDTRDLSEPSILLIGADSRGDLPGTIVEIKAIEKLLSGIGVRSFQTLYGSEANRHNFIEMLSSGKFNILHFSGHSVFKVDSPYQSYLELAQGTKLSLHELDNLASPENGDHPLNLVFLNSCQSGRIGIDKITGRNLSMCRMFREAGIDNVIGMLWNVSDEAATQFASVFYKFLATGNYADVSEAMRQTRREIAMDRAWQDGSWLAPVLYT